MENNSLYNKLTQANQQAPSMEGFQAYIQNKYPNMGTADKTAFNDFVTNQTKAALVKQGGYDYNTLAKESPSTALSLLQGGYKIPPTLTAEQKNRIAALKPAKQIVNSFNSSDLNLNEVGTAKAQAVKAKEGFPLGLGRMFIGKDEQNLANLDQKFELLKQNVVRALQGSRMSDTDIATASNYVPSIQDSKDTVQTKLKNLNEFLSGLDSGVIGTSEATTLSSQASQSGRYVIESVQ